MHHFIRFNCSREEKTSILKLIRLHIPQPNLAFPSLHRFESYLGDPEQACTTWEFCDYCHNVYEDDELNCPTCDTPRFEGENQTMKHFFLVFDPRAELKTRYLDPRFWGAIQSKFHREVEEGVISDIYDGTLYQSHPELDVPGNISAIASTDGIKIFKSNNQQLWMIMMVINELPPQVRFKEQNMIFLGAWFGKDKPNFHIVFPKIANILNSLATNGLDVLIPNGENRHITLTLLTFQADNPAKDAILEKEMNACPTCEQEPELANNVNGNPTVSVFSLPEVEAPFRTRDSILDNAEAATAGGESDHGIKAYPPLSLFANLELRLPTEYQHNICLRVMLKLLTLWFSTTKAGEPFNFSGLVPTFNRLMKLIKPPFFVPRPPRGHGDIKH